MFGGGAQFPAMPVFAAVVRRATFTVVSLIAIAVALVVFGASDTNAVVDAMRDAGSWLAQPFDGAFDVGASKADVALDWSLAAVAYAVAGGLLARLVR